MPKFITDRKKKKSLFLEGIWSFFFFQVVVDKIQHVLQGHRHFSFCSLRFLFFLHHRGRCVIKSFFEVHHQVCLEKLLVHHKVLCQSHVLLLHLQHLRTGHICFQAFKKASSRVHHHHHWIPEFTFNGLAHHWTKQG